MINGIIKLFYSEVVKSKIKAMPSGDYNLSDKGQELRNVTLKIESLFLKILQVFIGFIILTLAFVKHPLLGIGVFLVEMLYLWYKIKLEEDIISKIEVLKAGIGEKASTLIKEDGKLNVLTQKDFNENLKGKINALIILLIIGKLTEFNYIVIGSFVIVFIFTIKDIYSNIRKDS